MLMRKRVNRYKLMAFRKPGATKREIIADKPVERTSSGHQAPETFMFRPGDTLVVHSLNRLSRNKHDILDVLRYFREQGIRLKTIDLLATMLELPEDQE